MAGQLDNPLDGRGAGKAPMLATGVPLVDTADLAAAISEFQSALPGWWFSVATCSVSRDASCGPDRQGPDAALLEIRLFDSGFHVDLRDGSTAQALRNVMNQALAAKAILAGTAQADALNLLREFWDFAQSGERFVYPAGSVQALSTMFGAAKGSD